MNHTKFKREPIGISTKKVESRNEKVLKFFHDIVGRDDISLVGDAEKPTIVVDYKFTISVYIKNFEIIFLDAFDDGKEIWSINLDDYASVDGAYINDIILPRTGTRPVWSIMLNTGGDNKFYLCGYNFDSNSRRHPVFSINGPKVFFKEDYTQKILEELISEGYDVMIPETSCGWSQNDKNEKQEA